MCSLFQTFECPLAAVAEEGLQRARQAPAVVTRGTLEAQTDASLNAAEPDTVAEPAANSPSHGPTIRKLDHGSVEVPQEAFLAILQVDD